MYKKTILFLLTTVMLNAYTDLGVYGETYDIKERDFMEEVEERARKVNLKELEETIKNAAKESLMITSTIKTCKISKRRIFKPLIKLEHDVIIPYTNVVLRKKGSTYNILKESKLLMPYHLMFIDGNDEVQIELAKLYKSKLKHQIRIFLTKGDFLKISKDSLLESIMVARDAHEIKAFKVECVPSLYTQKNYNFEVIEYNPEELKKKEEPKDE